MADKGAGNPLGLRREPKDTIQLTTWNVQGIVSCNKASNDHGFRRYIEAENAHIVVLTEVHETRATLESDLQFDFLRKLYPYRYWGHMCGVLSKIEPVDVTFGFPEGNALDKMEAASRAITVEYKTVFVLGTYVPNSGANGSKLDRRRAWAKDFERHIRQLDPKKPVIWTGDFNVVVPDKDKDTGRDKVNLSLDLEKPSMCFTSQQPGTHPLEIQWHKELIERKPDARNPRRPSADPIFVDVWRLIHPKGREFT
ncbi:hypothetical protein OIV83_003384 [Microbotryomycetes sp. JL201]|nr:hypothetical protein OIV83_003384 [Microbotryomycetes sp. JL201]